MKGSVGGSTHRRSFGLVARLRRGNRQRSCLETLARCGGIARAACMARITTVFSMCRKHWPCQPNSPAAPPNMLTDAAHLGALAPIVAVLPWARRAITARWVFDSPPLRCHSMHMTHRHLVAREFHSASRLGRRCIGNRFAQRHYDRSFQVSNSLRGVKAMRLSGRQTGPDV